MTPKAQSVYLCVAQGVVVSATVAAILGILGTGAICLVGTVLPGFIVLGLIASLFRGKARRQAIRLALYLVSAGGYIAFLLYSTSPSALFRRYVADPIPESVQILHSEYESASPDFSVYIHFRMEPGDLASILDGLEYGQADADSLRPGIQNSICSCPEWWDPASLTSPRFYSWDVTAAERARLWINADGTEAYFVLGQI